MNQPDLLAVYGTLRRGGGANALLRDAEYIGQSEINGSIYNLGPFPAYKRHMAGPEPVKVDVYRLPDTASLERCDRYEGYHEDAPEQSLYLRVRIMTADARPVWVWVYEFNGEVEETSKIKTGDWFNP